jgi:hypothetical protein
MMFPVHIFVRCDALDKWTKKTGRALTGTEGRAVAKMRLFQALDEIEDFAIKRPELVMDESNLPRAAGTPGPLINPFSQQKQ